MIYNLISKYKYEKSTPIDYAFLRTPTNDFYVYEGATYEAYLAHNYGVYVRRLDNNLTTKFTSHKNLNYLDFVIYKDKYYLLVDYESSWSIVYIDNEEYKEVPLNLENVSKAFLVAHEEDVLVIYLRDNTLYQKTLRTGFKKEEKLSDKDFSKQYIDSVMLKDDTVYINILVADNTLLTHIDNFKFLKDKVFTEIPFSLGSFKVKQ